MASVEELSAGAALFSSSGDTLLVIRVRSSHYELPKGHVESGESPQDAASRELCEETGLIDRLPAGEPLGDISYSFVDAQGREHSKRVQYFRFELPAGATFGARPRGTRELRWVTAQEFAILPLVNEELRSLVVAGFGTKT